MCDQKTLPVLPKNCAAPLLEVTCSASARPMHPFEQRRRTRGYRSTFPRPSRKALRPQEVAHHLNNQAVDRLRPVHVRAETCHVAGEEARGPTAKCACNEAARE